ncbi:hypothetical protein FGIG_01264 [Fasciola gigantica]|uniref:Uncharacterized protein n=1 Tax=Fasciola gigantica TaxID=46835 RepID=A0A504YS05_FASGI|nr:hypothetical protein FGIG_01264 [Fasciola gigantica]
MQRSVSKRSSLALKDLRIVQQPKPDTSKTKDLLRRVSQLVNEIKSNPPEPCEGTADDGRYIDLNIFVDNSQISGPSNLVLDDVEVHDDDSKDQNSDMDSSETSSNASERSSSEPDSPVIKKRCLITELAPTDSSPADRQIR